MDPYPFNPGVAAVLSFFFPGLGQIYKGQFTEAVMFMIMALFFYALFFPAGMCVHAAAVYDAYNRRKTPPPASPSSL